MKLIQLVLFCIFTFYAFVAYGQTDQTDFSGVWYIAKQVPTSGIVGLTQEEANSYLNTTIFYLNKTATFGNEICQGPNYVITKSDEDTFSRETYNSFDKLSIKGKYIYHVELQCKSESKGWFYGGSFYYNDENRLLILIDGVWFELVRKSI